MIPGVHEGTSSPEACSLQPLSFLVTGRKVQGKGGGEGGHFAHSRCSEKPCFPGQFMAASLLSSISSSSQRGGQSAGRPGDQRGDEWRKRVAEPQSGELPSAPGPA